MVLHVAESGMRLGKDGGRFVITKDNKEIQKIPIGLVEAIILYNGCSITSSGINEIVSKGIHLIYVSTWGKYISRLDSVPFYNIERQVLQFQQYRNNKFCLEMSKKLIKAKIQNSSVIIRRLYRNENTDIAKVIDVLNTYKAKTEKARNIDILRGIEGTAAKIYFESISSLLPEQFRFTTRSKNPPRDSFNSVLSFGYTLLYNEIFNSLVVKGLHPYIGFMHRIRNGHAALVSDLMEQWRAYIVDSLVVNLFKNDFFTEVDFTKDNKSNAIYLSTPKSKEFVKEFENKIISKNAYFKDNNDSISNRQVIEMQAEYYVKSLNQSDSSIYKTFVIR